MTATVKIYDCKNCKKNMMFEVFADEQTTLKIIEQNPYCEVCEQVQKTGMKQVQIKDVKKGEFIRRKPEAKTTFIRGQYDRSMKDYSCTDFMDTNREIFLKGTAKVWIDFTF